MKKIFLQSLLSSLLLISCNDFLAVEPDGQTSISQQLSTEKGVLKAYIGIYRDIEAAQSSRYHGYPDIQGGNTTFIPNKTNHILDIPTEIENSYSFNDNYLESDYRGYYEDLYNIINQVNVILEHMGGFSFFTTTELHQLQAELLTIRAFAHYQLCTYYAQQFGYTANGSSLGIVYNTKTLIAGVDFPSRKTVVETYELLKNDLETAIDLYSKTKLLAGPDYSYFNKTNTYALYARIALQMNDWQKAHNLSNTVINTSGIVLTSKNDYVAEWKKEETPINEVLLEFTAPRTSEGDVSSSISSFYNINNNHPITYTASKDLIALYTTNDIRKELFIEENLTTLQNNKTTLLPYTFIHKFQKDSGTLCIRLSEIYLIRAEAEARLGNISNALADLNTIRNRANLNSITDTTNLLDEIFDERRRELAFEGFLLFDIARFKKNIVRNTGCLSDVCNLDYPSHYFVLPIPSSSIDLNQNIKQNAGY